MTQLRLTYLSCVEALAGTCAEFLTPLGRPAHDRSSESSAEEASIRRRRLEMIRFNEACDASTIQPKRAD